MQGGIKVQCPLGTASEQQCTTPIRAYGTMVRGPSTSQDAAASGVSYEDDGNASVVPSQGRWATMIILAARLRAWSL